MIGQTISHYEITGLVGRGGMGEVYRARDTRLDREVALKILPRDMSGDPERIARFQREARTLATLQHQNIASIYDFEDTGELRFLVMELVEGEDLAERLARDGALPVDEAVRIATQIAAGLEVAHEQGIVHRDLKPANVKIGPDGQAKVLDFGLARAIEGSEMEGDPALSPTITAAMTQPGTILGTAAYMSPEQARGRRVDKRSDIWSFGIILYEMLTGAPLFVGETITDTITGILHVQPDFDRLPAGTPPRVRRLLARCLDKDPTTRLRDIGEFRIALAAAGKDEDSAARSNDEARPARARMAWIIAFAALLGCGLLAFALLQVGRQAPQPELRVSIAAPIGMELNWNSASAGALSLSPDGSKMTFAVAGERGSWNLYLRSLDAEEAQPIPASDGATFPFWSPDGQFLAYFVDGKLKKLDVRGGAPITVCDAPDARGGSWSKDDVILFTPSTQAPLFRVAASGGIPVAITELDPSRGRETTHRYPYFLPDGEHYLYLRASHTGSRTDPVHSIWVGKLGSEETTALFASSSNAEFALGHIFWLNDGILMARAFDPEALHFEGDPFPVGESVLLQASYWQGAFATSASGALAFQHGSTELKRLAWFDRAGNELSALGREGIYDTIALSPANDQVAMSLDSEGSGGTDIWIHDLDRNLPSRLTFEDSEEKHPVWSPDGKRLAYFSTEAGTSSIMVRNVDGTGEPEVLYENLDIAEPTSWSPDGRVLLYNAIVSGYDLHSLDLESGETEGLVSTDAEEGWGRFSPDGKWIAYLSDADDQFNLYLRRFPGDSGKWQLTTRGADWILDWNAEQSEIYYIDLAGALCAVKVDLRGRVTSEHEELLFSTQSGMSWTSNRDGSRFLLGVPVGSTERPPITLVLNWKGMR